MSLGPLHGHSLLGGEVQAVENIPGEKNGPHVAEVKTVEAEGHQQRKKQQVHGLPGLERDLRVSRAVCRGNASGA